MVPGLQIDLIKSPTVLRNISVLYTNSDQLLNKFDELNSRIITEKPDLILLVEVFPKVNDYFLGSPRLHIPFYTFLILISPPQVEELPYTLLIILFQLRYLFAQIFPNISG